MQRRAKALSVIITHSSVEKQYERSFNVFRYFLCGNWSGEIKGGISNADR